MQLHAEYIINGWKEWKKEKLLKLGSNYISVFFYYTYDIINWTTIQYVANGKQQDSCQIFGKKITYELIN